MWVWIVLAVLGAGPLLLAWRLLRAPQAPPVGDKVWERELRLDPRGGWLKEHHGLSVGERARVQDAVEAGRAVPDESLRAIAAEYAAWQQGEASAQRRRQWIVAASVMGGYLGSALLAAALHQWDWGAFGVPVGYAGLFVLRLGKEIYVRPRRLAKAVRLNSQPMTSGDAGGHHS
ncbi:hypothetical protein [Actinomadura parmotrematis]|uniref:Uncharacterized protein n=1 Tax=Actinomadura parmotrematis TaxID=2864039 RepID=A0ABS7G5U5_9ACTN|nr:hypothetical protein [Actinomadura parmotrematis]MBW8487750.1 hypothetical protein [Actinomadura parmotrematis]